MIAEAVESGSVTLGGDMRADTPGIGKKIDALGRQRVASSHFVEEEFGESPVLVSLHINIRGGGCGKVEFRWQTIYRTFTAMTTPCFLTACTSHLLEKSKTVAQPNVAKMSPEYHTSSLESFHSLILRFAPKNVVFHSQGCCAGYIDKLMGLLFESVVEDATTYQRFTEQIPIPEKLCARFVRPDKKMLSADTGLGFQERIR
ncbi:hypothetical protein WMY93_001980 [Mugilogobius chulae]|uniref:Uncharacterized protein n=1 Tax=Mugilogobius chulae TaxID=88201 RepID=A0AAW0Q3E0_9GOBI